MQALIRNATVLTQDAKRRVLRGYDIAVEDGRISKIAKAIPGKAETEIDASGKLAMPGLVNAHTHSAMTLFRGMASDMEFFEAWKTRLWPAEKALAPRDVLAGTRLALLEMVRSGTTSFLDMYFYGEEAARACEEVGVRGVLTRTFFSSPMLDASLAEAVRPMPRQTPLVSWGYSPHAPYTVDEEGYAAAEAASKKTGRVLTTHLAETRKEVHDFKKKNAKREIEWFAEKGLLSGRLVAAHCVWITKREASLLGKYGASVAHCPVSNMKLAGGGAAPVPELVAAGANVCLGTDGAASNDSLNMLDTMKCAALLHKNWRWDALAAPARHVLDFATINGAKALKIDAGSLEAGKLADIALLDLSAPNLAPAYLDDYASLVVYAANPGNVTDVVINGKLVLSEGKFVSADEKKIVADAVRTAEALRACR